MSTDIEVSCILLPSNSKELTQPESQGEVAPISSPRDKITTPTLQEIPEPSNSLYEAIDASDPAVLKDLLKAFCAKYSFIRQNVEKTIMPPPPFLYNYARENFDEVVWDKNDEDWNQAKKELTDKASLQKIDSFMADIFGKPAKMLHFKKGGFNNLFQYHIEGMNSDVMIRRPSNYQSQFPVEKTRKEVVIGKFIKQKTKIPTPEIHFASEKSDVGPYMIIEHIDCKSTLSSILNVPGREITETHSLNPKISEATLKTAYSQAAVIVLEMMKPKFERIGALIEASDGSFQVSGRPLTQNMSDMVQLCNIPPAVLPSEMSTFATADEYYLNLTREHLTQLVLQHNDLVKSESDCKNKYVARHLFHQLAQQGRLSTFGFTEDNWSFQSTTDPSPRLPMPSNTSSFRLFGDDFRPGNMLVDASNDIISVIDWEFTYAAPTQFSLNPPWWLLIDTPEMWDAGIEDWTEKYEMRLKTWLEAMGKAEDDTSAACGLEYKLEAYMRENWRTGRFWLDYAARNSWAFDAIYWGYLDERFFGGRDEGLIKDELWKSRFELSSEDVRDGMEAFVERKMDETKERKLMEWDPEVAKRRVEEILLDRPRSESTEEGIVVLDHGKPGSLGDAAI